MDYRTLFLSMTEEEFIKGKIFSNFHRVLNLCTFPPGSSYIKCIFLFINICRDVPHTIILRTLKVFTISSSFLCLRGCFFF